MSGSSPPRLGLQIAVPTDRLNYVSSTKLSIWLGLQSSSSSVAKNDVISLDKWCGGDSKRPLVSPRVENLTLADSGLHPIQVVDVREDDAAGGCVPGSLNIPYKDFKTQLPHLVRAVRASYVARRYPVVVVFHCMYSKERGPTSALMFQYEWARQHPSPSVPGPQVYVLWGGMRAWINTFCVAPASSSTPTSTSSSFQHTSTNNGNLSSRATTSQRFDNDADNNNDGCTNVDDDRDFVDDDVVFVDNGEDDASRQHMAPPSSSSSSQKQSMLRCQPSSHIDRFVDSFDLRRWQYTDIGFVYVRPGSTRDMSYNHCDSCNTMNGSICSSSDCSSTNNSPTNAPRGLGSSPASSENDQPSSDTSAHDNQTFPLSPASSRSSGSSGDSSAGLHRPQLSDLYAASSCEMIDGDELELAGDDHELRPHMPSHNYELPQSTSHRNAASGGDTQSAFNYEGADGVSSCGTGAGRRPDWMSD